jgi:histone H3/H4
MSKVLTVNQIRTQIAVRTAWEDKMAGGISKCMQQIAASFGRKIHGESDLSFRTRAIGEIVKRMNVEGVPKDAKKALYALDVCDKLPQEVIGNKLVGIPFNSDEMAMKLADIAWEEGAKHGLEVMTY